MKTKIAILAIVAVGFLSSCASPCGADKWRKRRFVETEVKVQQPVSDPAERAA